VRVPDTACEIRTPLRKHRLHHCANVFSRTPPPLALLLESAPEGFLMVGNERSGAVGWHAEDNVAVVLLIEFVSDLALGHHASSSSQGSLRLPPGCFRWPRSAFGPGKHSRAEPDKWQQIPRPLLAPDRRDTSSRDIPSEPERVKLNNAASPIGSAIGGAVSRNGVTMPAKH